MRLEGIDHVALAVRNVAESIEWYRTVLGLERRHADVWGNVPAMMGTGTTLIALFPVGTDRPDPVPDRGAIAMRHLAFRADAVNFAAAQRELATRAIPFEFQDHQISHSIYFVDPDGHRLEITTYDLTT